MMSMTAGEGTNSDGRGATTTVPENGKTDAEMNGMKGAKIAFFLGISFLSRV